MKNELKHHGEGVQSRTLCGTLLRMSMMRNSGCEICKNRLDGSAVNPVCVKTRPRIVETAV